MKNQLLYDLISNTRLFIMSIMPVRGPFGFRELRYEWARDPKQFKIKDIVEKCYDYGFNGLGIVIKDTDGAAVWDTKIGWNPTERDILGEFIDECRDYNIKVFGSFTIMEDSYQGHLFPERVAVSFKGTPAYSKAFEMRVKIPEGSTLEVLQKTIPFLTNEVDLVSGTARKTRGKGYIPTTAIMCPSSDHIKYTEDLAYEVVKNYKIDALLGDYVRYTWLKYCFCKKCQYKYFQINNKRMPVLARLRPKWIKFREDNIASIAYRFHKAIKLANPNCISGAFILPEIFYKMHVRLNLGQNYIKLSKVLDVLIPMTLAYIAGSIKDSRKERMLGDFVYKTTNRMLKKIIPYCYPSEILNLTCSSEVAPSELVTCLKTYDEGNGVGIFEYFGTSEENWRLIRKYIENHKNSNYIPRSVIKSRKLKNWNIEDYIQEDFKNLKQRVKAQENKILENG